MRRKLTRPAMVATAFLALPVAAWSDEGISTDRPDFVESSSVVGAHRFQIETGFSSERDKSAGLKTTTRTTPTLLRIGMNDTLEFRIETDGATRVTTEDQALGTKLSERGYSDVSFGMKWHMRDGDEKKGTPAIAWLAHLDVDTGSPAFRGQGLRPSLRMVAEWELPQDFSVGVMPGFVADRNEDGKRFVGGILAVTLGKGWGDKWHTFVEIAGQQLASKSNGGSVVTFDAGATYLLTESAQLDVSISRGLTSYTPDLQWGVGLSLRF